MASPLRIEKLNILLKDILAKIIDREIEFPENVMVTITHVTVASSAHYATVFISVLGGSSSEVLEIFRKNVYNIQQQLNKKLRMRPVPKIKFALDEEEIRRETVEKSLAELKRKKEI